MNETLTMMAVGTGLSLMRTAAYEHRELTHKSLEAWPTIATAFRVGGSHLADSKRWAGVHRLHHNMPDVNLLPFVEYADCRDWVSTQSSATERRFEIPDAVMGFDPAAKEISAEEAYLIGQLARKSVKDFYQPEEFGFERAKEVLEDTSARYLYEHRSVMKADRKNPPRYIPDELPSLDRVRFLLRDPHAPNLHKMGVPGILLFNVPHYAYVEQSLGDPAYRLEDLRDDKLDESLRQNRGLIRLGYVALVSGINVALKQPTGLDKTMQEILIGGAASGIIVLGLIQGGNITNGLGHGGDYSRTTLRDFLSGYVIPKPDGTYTSNSTLMAGPTLDEVGGQDEHHRDPSLIAYTTEKGWKKIAKAPFGSGLEFMAKHNILFKPGRGFPDQEKRPDMPSEAAEILRQARVKYMAQNENFATAA